MDAYAQPPAGSSETSFAEFRQVANSGITKTNNVDIDDLVVVRLPADLRSAVWKASPLVFPFYEKRVGEGYTYMRNVGQRPMSYLSDQGFKDDAEDLRSVLRVHCSYLGEIAFGAAVARHFGGQASALAFCDDVRTSLTAYRERLLAYADGDITAGEWKRRIEMARRAGDCLGLKIAAAPGVVYGFVIGAADGSKDYEIHKHDGSIAPVDIKNYAHIKSKAQHSSHYVIGEDHLRSDGGALGRSLMVDVRQYDPAGRDKIFVQTLIAREAAIRTGTAIPDIIDLRSEGEKVKTAANDIMVIVAGAMCGLSLSDLALPADPLKRTQNCRHLPVEAVAAARVLGKVRQACFERGVPALESPYHVCEAIGSMARWGEVDNEADETGASPSPAMEFGDLTVECVAAA